MKCLVLISVFFWLTISVAEDSKDDSILPSMKHQIYTSIKKSEYLTQRSLDKCLKQVESEDDRDHVERCRQLRSPASQSKSEIYECIRVSVMNKVFQCMSEQMQEVRQ